MHDYNTSSSIKTELSGCIAWAKVNNTTLIDENHTKFINKKMNNRQQTIDVKKGWFDARNKC